MKKETLIKEYAKPIISDVSSDSLLKNCHITHDWRFLMVEFLFGIIALIIGIVLTRIYDVKDPGLILSILIAFQAVMTIIVVVKYRNGLKNKVIVSQTHIEKYGIQIPWDFVESIHLLSVDVMGSKLKHNTLRVIAKNGKKIDIEFIELNVHQDIVIDSVLRHWSRHS